MARTDFSYFYSMRVRWSEVDRQDVVFNGHYLTFFDVAMTEYLRALGYPYPQGLLDAGTDFYVKKSELEYHASATFDDVLEIHTRVSRIGNSSMTFSFEIYRENETDLLVSGSNVYVNVSLESRRSASLPTELTDRIRKHEKVAPE